MLSQPTSFNRCAQSILSGKEGGEKRGGKVVATSCGSPAIALRARDGREAAKARADRNGQGHSLHAAKIARFEASPDLTAMIVPMSEGQDRVVPPSALHS